MTIDASPAGHRSLRPPLGASDFFTSPLGRSDAVAAGWGARPATPESNLTSGNSKSLLLRLVVYPWRNVPLQFLDGGFGGGDGVG